ncbi:calcium/calmodulin-dependent 3',5'-cyclic nucleotide phosphodiesterase 1-like [Chelonus insularis]|uniref:calcium/calmodulin-dependent 3',5'-cyclic nucleotide phosphodiesterase 1-like n=1 Tax=Chelonus insularis TaxID=460826 RepID=UPI00158BAE88|nr:calcium/calmodulin-dependent 3',5'-cyclic nucleotide phosphodiesterase 1-like [Chelonus insularis]XP_034949630.1 calcium/calmodulin-dependent 3',5'-cyclic nucleotide phosphodiesterase 1-like [Chelonus insularis]XP_034949631.1 calcium/calmodulin-dependent 3',5'-cyclic nucleotide phosphodiesterase 1-like [Chelonus insularis]XP_034949632.1 calcium/calmodulin-dependent 3',5'-cyclic nucleotide phosphodiesterase 1-like [Chelonus insularis]
MTQELGSLKLVQGSSVKHDSGGSSNFSKNSGSPKLNYDSRRISKNQSLHLDDPSVVKEVENDSLPTIDTPEACDKAARRLRWVLQRLDNGGMSVELLRNNLQYAARVLETVSVREMKRSVEEDDEFSDVQTNAVPIEVREWLASTFTRQVGSTKCKMDEKPKFRSVAQAIRAGIFVERITRKVTNYNLMQFPPEVLKVFKGLDDWSFNTFSLNDVAQGTPLKYLGYDLLNRYGIIRKFKIPPLTLENFLTRIEEGYCQHKNPYHNNIHAADVTQTMHYILSKAGLTNWLTELEIFASLVAAIIHDYQHTGTTNNFHVMAGSDTALLYNDRAVLENHHVSASFRIMKEEEFNILRNLSKEDYRKFRSLVIDMVLATDMSFHFQQLKNMKTLLAVAEPVVDKSKVISLVLHCCDISHPSKKWDLHYRWTMQLLEEFFRQGDMEQELGLPFSPLCDRKNTLVAESQIGFIEFIVEPSMQICGDVLDFVLAPLNKKDNIDDTASSEAKRFRILRPWNQCLVENKKLWKEEALRVAALQPAA